MLRLVIVAPLAGLVTLLACGLRVRRCSRRHFVGRPPGPRPFGPAASARR